MADDAIRERIFKQSIDALTSRMQVALLTAQEEARRRGHAHIGTEHVFLAILQDPNALPTQLLAEVCSIQDAIDRIRELLASDGYNRALPSAGDK